MSRGALYLRDRLLLVAGVGADLVAEEPPNTNHGYAVRQLQRRNGGGLDDPWCCHAVQYAGNVAAGKLWPFAPTGYVPTLVDMARQRGMLRPVAECEPGDLIAFWHEKAEDGPRFAHVGIVVRRDHMVLNTSEGNTSDPAHANAGDPLGREGWRWARRVRGVQSADIAIDWTRGLGDEILPAWLRT